MPVVASRLLARGCGLKLCRRFSLHKLSEEHAALQQLARKFAREKLLPVATKLDQEQTFPHEQIKELGELGLLSIAVEQRWGGCGQNMLALSLVVEEISKACGATGAIVSIHNCLYANLLDRCGTDAQKEEFLVLPEPGSIGCFALSESVAGSDVSAMQTTAQQDGDGFVLNGIKSWVTSGTVGKAAVVFATIDRTAKHKGITAFLVPIQSQGLRLSQKDNKLGIRAAESCEIVLEDVRVPKNYVLGSLGEGFKIAMVALDRARVGIASQAVGIGQAALDLAVVYSTQRKAFGKKLRDLQAVKLRISEMAVRLEAARLLVRRAAATCDESGDCSTKESSMAKLAASQAANFAAYNCIQILGGMGYVTDMPAERYFRDARITEIYGGVSDIQKLVIADLVIKECGSE